MKKYIILLILSLLLISLLSAAPANVVAKEARPSGSSMNRNTSTWFLETFENGEGNWTTGDGNIPAHMWHLTNNSSLTHGGSGYSWWMGDPETHGYTNAQILYLQTPFIAVPTANPTLTFDINWFVEDLGGDTIGGVVFDGWDGINVRLQVQGSNDWTVITPTAPVYNSTSMYGFGYNGDGAWPGWGHTSNGWQAASFNLSAYAGQQVSIRWVFASDPAYSTAENSSLFGVVLDNIRLGSFDHNFNDGDMQGMTFGTSHEGKPNLWHVGPHPTAPSPTNAFKCHDENSTYLQWMYNFLYSDWIELPPYGIIIADFMLRGSLQNVGTDLTRNYFAWEIRTETSPWYAMSNPYGASGGTNYIYVSTPDAWSSMIDSYSLDGDISKYQGQNVQFRWTLRTRSLDPVGDGMMIDNLAIYQTIILPPAKDVVATVNPDNSVAVNWVDPYAINDFEPGWKSHSGDIMGTALWFNSDDQPYRMTAANRFSHDQLNEMNALGGVLTKVAFYHAEPNASNHTIRVWTDGMGIGNPGDLIIDQIITQPLILDAWNEIVLSTPVPIEHNKELRIGVRYDCQPGDGAYLVLDTTEAVNAYGNIYFGEFEFVSWQALSPERPFNIMIKGYAEDSTGRPITISNSRSRNFNITGFKILRRINNTGSFTEIGEVGINTSFTDMEPVGNSINSYQIVALYEEGIAEPSNHHSVFVISPSANVLSYDDGVSVGNPISQGAWINRYELEPTGNEDLHRIMAVQYWLNQVGNQALTLLVFDEVNNMPNQQIYSQLISGGIATNVVGWNYALLNITPILEMSGGKFFLGFSGLGGASRLGYAGNTNGMSLSRNVAGSGEFAPFNDGVYMIRIITDRFTNDIDKPEIPIAKLSANNYPNPFNPETIITFNMPKDGKVEIAIFNIRGQLVHTLLNDEVKAGENKVVWTGNDSTGKAMSSGVYFYRVQTTEDSIINRMVLMK